MDLNSFFQQREGIAGSHEETPLASACARGYRDVAELLIHNGANVNYLCSVSDWALIQYLSDFNLMMSLCTMFQHPV